MNKIKRIKRMLEIRRIMRLLNKFRKTDIAYIYLENYYMARGYYGITFAEDELLNIGYDTILNEITEELFKGLKEIV